MSMPRAGAEGGALERVWRSIFRMPLSPESDRDRKRIVFHHLVLHFRPLSLPRATLRYTHTFGLGGMSLVLFSLLAGTGILLMFVYEPSPERAHASLEALGNEVRFGRLVRGVHHWSANLLVLVAGLHLLRVFFTGGFQGVRRFNWVIGLGLLLGLLLSNFTGYLLPWDQLSYWAVTICTGMLGYVPGAGPWLRDVLRGGPEIGSATLITFYTLHTTLLPVTMVLLLAFHFWRVRKAGGVVIPEEKGSTGTAKPPLVLFLPHLFFRELAVALILVAGVLLYATLRGAPLGDPANPGMSPNPAKAPWYFLGIQELLLHFHPLTGVVLLPFLGAAGLLLIPYLTYDRESTGRWFQTSNGRRTAALAGGAALLLTPLWIVIDERVPPPSRWLSGVPPAVAEGILPLLLLGSLLALVYVLLKRRLGLTNNESIQGLFTFLLVAFLVLTAVGIWFRGAGMALVWPWNT
jgi:quinol-cytochrome oxidoreductase complex cytochrome b subunit